jgi:hypothetical protein
MQSHVIAASRWAWRHRRQIALLTALAATAGASILIAPILLTVAAIEWKQTGRQQRLLSIALLLLLIRAISWLWRELRRIPHAGWHPCGQCGVPIAAPSRAEYCSPACRRDARFTREETARRTAAIAQFGEAPF